MKSSENIEKHLMYCPVCGKRLTWRNSNTKICLECGYVYAQEEDSGIIEKEPVQCRIEPCKYCGGSPICQTDYDGSYCICGNCGAKTKKVKSGIMAISEWQNKKYSKE